MRNNNNEFSININLSIYAAQVCSGLGDCNCGVCKCKSSLITGKFCEICPRCESQAYCNLMFKCVPKICELYASNCTDSCDQMQYELVDKLVEVNNTDGLYTTLHQCRNRTINNECDLSLTYSRTDYETKRRPTFKITKLNKSCAEKVNLVVVSSSVFIGWHGTGRLTGLALLLLWILNK